MLNQVKGTLMLPLLHVPRYIIPRYITLYILGYFYFNSPIDTVAELCTVVEVVWADKVKKSSYM